MHGRDSEQEGGWKAKRRDGKEKEERRKGEWGDMERKEEKRERETLESSHGLVKLLLTTLLVFWTLMAALVSSLAFSTYSCALRTLDSMLSISSPYRIRMERQLFYLVTQQTWSTSPQTITVRADFLHMD